MSNETMTNGNGPKSTRKMVESTPEQTERETNEIKRDEEQRSKLHTALAALLAVSGVQNAEGKESLPSDVQRWTYDQVKSAFGRAASVLSDLNTRRTERTISAVRGKIMAVALPVVAPLKAARDAAFASLAHIPEASRAMVKASLEGSMANAHTLPVASFAACFPNGTPDTTILAVLTSIKGFSVPQGKVDPNARKVKISFDIVPNEGASNAK